MQRSVQLSVPVVCVLLAAACGAETPGPGGTGNTGGAANPTGGTNASAGTGNPAGGAATNGGTGVATGGAGTVAGTSSGGTGTVAGTNSGGTGTAGTGTGPSNEYWIGPEGSDANPGTEAQPFAHLSVAITLAQPGVTFWVKPGNYSWTGTVLIEPYHSGTAAMPVKLFAAPGGRPVLDFAGQTRGQDSLRGINVNGDYWHIKGLELKNTSDNCIGIAGAYNTIEDVIVHECGDTGIQITVPSAQVADNTRGANNTILNCDSWGNLDTETGGENADGFAAKERIGPGNVFRGSRAWNNADDGWDLYGANDVVKIENCWAFSNGKPIGGTNPEGDGNGFKLGGDGMGEPGQGGAVHLVSGCFGFDNESCGFTRNNNPSTPQLTSCGADANGTDYCSLSVSSEVSMSMSASTARTIARNADGSLPPMN